MISLIKGKRKYLFCCDAEGAESLYTLVQQVMEAKVSFDLHIIEQDFEPFLYQWFSEQKMGTYLYISGRWEVVKVVKNIAIEVGFSQHDMQILGLGPIRKKVICSKCHAVNEVNDELFVTCGECGLELDVSNHYSRRLDGYLGYYSIK